MLVSPCCPSPIDPLYGKKYKTLHFLKLILKEGTVPEINYVILINSD